MNTKTFVELPTPIGSEFINPEEVICIKANNKSIKLCMENRKEDTIKLPFKIAEELFSYNYFVKCHRSHIINILKIKCRNYKDKKILLVNKLAVPLSDNYKENFEKTLKEFCKK